jgi:hypothetical protein
MSEEIVRETISVSRTSISEEEKAVASEYNQFVIRGLRRADHLLRFGTPEVQLRLCVAAISSSSRLAALDSKTITEEHRTAFESLVDDITRIPEIQQVVTESEVIDVEPKALVRSVDDKDDVLANAEARLKLHRPRPDDR